MKNQKKKNVHTQKRNGKSIELPHEANDKCRKRQNNLSKTGISTPALLLSYTYFLNSNHTCYISIGYDVDTFKLKVIVYKNMINQEWMYEDWDYLYKNSTVIQDKFLGNQKNDTNLSDYNIKTNVGGNKMSCKVLLLQQDRQAITFKTDTSKITMVLAEWMLFYKILNFLNSVIKMYNSVWYEVEQYYNLYYDRCKQLQVDELPQNEYFIPIPTTYNCCNFSRLFNEIPILCQKKLQQDRYSNTTYNTC